MTGPRILLVLGNQLFPPRTLGAVRDAVVFMAEDVGLCTYVRHHQQKIVLFLAAMRHYADELREAGFEVHYHRLENDGELPYGDKLSRFIEETGAAEIVHFEIEDRAMEDRIRAIAREAGLKRTEIRSPMFLTSREEFEAFASRRKKLLMADFYREQRQRLGVLVDDAGKPLGGKWSFDADNRRKLPAEVEPPSVAAAPATPQVEAIVGLVAQRFGDHPGRAEDFWWPTTREQARAWLGKFIDERLPGFGPYEDAMTRRSLSVFHSLLSPLLNLGLLTPDEVLDAVLASQDDVPVQSTEGFVRQLIGWREFIRGIYRVHGQRQAAGNFFGHERDMTRDWYAGTTGIEPLDDVIRKTSRLGWAHHIERLMVLGNLMTLCEIRPARAWQWFMEMFVDSSEWVMGPNVFGMGIFSDGGLFATKPYICGSNYLRKMSDYESGDWCDVIDGLYWRFISRHRPYFEQNPRLAVMPRALDRLSAQRRRKIFAAAENFLARYTVAPQD